MDGDLNKDLLSRALNYHGQQLTSFMEQDVQNFSLHELVSRKCLPGKTRIELGNFYFQGGGGNVVDYHIYRQRSKELRIEDRGQRLLLHRFIAQVKAYIALEIWRKASLFKYPPPSSRMPKDSSRSTPRSRALCRPQIKRQSPSRPWFRPSTLTSAGSTRRTESCTFSRL